MTHAQWITPKPCWPTRTMPSSQEFLPVGNGHLFRHHMQLIPKTGHSFKAQEIFGTSSCCSMVISVIISLILLYTCIYVQTQTHTQTHKDMMYIYTYIYTMIWYIYIYIHTYLCVRVCPCDSLNISWLNPMKSHFAKHELGERTILWCRRCHPRVPRGWQSQLQGPQGEDMGSK